MEGHTSLFNILTSLLRGQDDLMSNASLFCSYIYNEWEDISWSGFYFLKNEKLLIGPHQGPLPCISIGPDKGACGLAFTSRDTVRIPDVNKFEDYIACDESTKSEIVIPLIKDNRVWGVFDLDSNKLDRFSDEDQEVLEGLVGIFLNCTNLQIK